LKAGDGVGHAISSPSKERVHLRFEDWRFGCGGVAEFGQEHDSA
jgi:hypothetical protein